MKAGLRQWCHLLPLSLKFYSKQSCLAYALEEHDKMVSIGKRQITVLHFADDIDTLAEKEK